MSTCNVSDCCDNQYCEVSCCCSHKVIIGHHAPDFTVPAVLGNGSIIGDYNFKKSTTLKVKQFYFLHYLILSYFLCKK